MRAVFFNEGRFFGQNLDMIAGCYLEEGRLFNNICA